MFAALVVDDAAADDECNIARRRADAKPSVTWAMRATAMMPMMLLTKCASGLPERAPDYVAGGGGDCGVVGC